MPADAKVICDYSDPDNGWAEFQRMREEGFTQTESDSDDDHGDGNENEKADEEGPSNDGNEHERDNQRPRSGYPLLACDHSAITGESLAVDRYVGDNVFYTTGCKRGKAYTVVQATGTASFVGRTASMVQGAQDTGHFKMVMDSIGTSLLVLVMAWILAMWIGGFYRNLPIAWPPQQTLLFYTLDLLIIGVPVGLPVVTTTTLAVGAAYLAKRKAIVQKLTAIESLSVRTWRHMQRTCC